MNSTSSSLPTLCIPNVPLPVSDGAQRPRFERQLSDNELSYFLPSRADGVNDMYLHIGFAADPSTISLPRLSLVWAIFRVQHPLLASSVAMESGAYTNVRFRYTLPSSAQAAIEEACTSIELKGQQDKDDLLDAYLNGPRTLSNSRLSYLVVSNGTNEREFNVLFCAAHFIGDGMALHQTANAFFSLLALTEEGLRAKLDEEWSKAMESTQPIPSSTESRMPVPKSKFQAAAIQVDFKASQRALVGGQSFPRAPQKSARRTVVPTISWDAAQTKAMIKKCKSESVSISSALFALCNIAWIRSRSSSLDKTLPTMMYSALNLRPYLHPSPSCASYWYLSVGYFNVILPTFLPSGSDDAKVFWNRARAAKTQSGKAVKNSMVVHRAQEMAKERGERARVWAKQDDDALAIPPSPVLLTPATPLKESNKRFSFVNSLLTPPPTPRSESPVGSPLPTSSTPPASPSPLRTRVKRAFSKVMSSIKRGAQPITPPLTPSPSVTQIPATPVPGVAKPPPSSALIGLSLLGNLDATYKPPVGFTLHTLTTGSRQRPGAMLLFNYTFAGKMWVSLGYDVNGFEKGVVEAFWTELQKGVDEFILA